MCWSRKFQLMLALTVTASLLLGSEANVAPELGLEPLVSPLYKPWLLPVKPSAALEHNVPALELNSNVDYLEFNGKNAISEPAAGQEHSQSSSSFAINGNKFIVRKPVPEIRVPTSHINTAQRPVEVHDSQFGYIQPQRPQQPQPQHFANIEANRLRPQMPELTPQKPLVVYENAFLQQKELQPESDSPKEANVLAYELKKAHESELIDSKTAKQEFAPQGTLHATALEKPHLGKEKKLSAQVNNDLNVEQKQITALKDTERKAHRREDMHITVIVEGPLFNKQNINRTAEILNSEHDSAVNVTVVVRGNGADAVLEEPSLALEAEATALKTDAVDKHESIALKAKPDAYEYNIEENETDRQKTQELLIQAALVKQQQTQKILALPACANGVAYLSHPSDCRRFILCINGNAMEMECKQELFWDGVNNVCSENSESCYEPPFEYHSEETKSVHSIKTFPFEEQSIEHYIEKMGPAYPTKDFLAEEQSFEQKKVAQKNFMLNSKPEPVNLLSIIMDNQSPKPDEVQQYETESNVKEQLALETIQMANELLNVAQTDRKTDSQLSQTNVEINQEIVEEEKSIGGIIISEASPVEKINDANKTELEKVVTVKKTVEKENKIDENKNEEIKESEIVSELTLTKETEMDASEVEDEPEIAKKEFQTFTIIKFVKSDENEQKEEEKPTVIDQEIKKYIHENGKKEEKKLETETVQKLTLTKEVETDENVEKEEKKLETQAVQKLTLTKEVEVNENMEKVEEKLENVHEAVKKFTLTKEVEINENMEKEEKKLVTEAAQKLTLTKEVEINENMEKVEEKLENEAVQKLTLTKEVEIDENMEKEEKKLETQAVQKFTLTKELQIDENAKEMSEHPEVIKEMEIVKQTVN